MLPIPQALYLKNTSEYSCIKDVLKRLKIAEETPSIYSVLCRVRDLLEHGIVINFVEKYDDTGSSTLYDTWHIWLSIINKTIVLYEEAAPDREYLSLLPKPESNESKFLVLEDPKAPFQDNSSNLQGLKLILVALLMLPIDEGQRNKAKNVAIHFKRGTSQIALYPYLELNFKKGNTRGLIYQCSELILNEYSEQSVFRNFLTSIRNSLILLNGYNLGRKTHKPSKDKKARPKKAKSSRIPGLVRLTPFYSDRPSFGGRIEIVAETGEESIMGVIEAPTSDPDESDISDDVSSASAQVKNKRWIQTYNETVPWNNRGINPFTHKILINWIKDNSSIESLILGMMLSTGKKIEDILNLEIGSNADLTIDGEYIRHYKAPENSFTPTSEQEHLMQPLNQVVKLTLPEIIKSRFKSMSIESDEGMTLAEAWDVDVNILKKKIQAIVKQLIQQGANGLAIDRIPLVLQKKVAEISQDEVLGYIISARENDIPPVSAYYTAYTHSYIESVYHQAVVDLYNG